MKIIKLIVILTLIVLNTAASQANARPAPEATPASAAKAHLEKMSTENGYKLYTHAASGLQFDVPPSWEAEADGDLITLTSADGALSVIFWVPEAGTLNESVKALDEELRTVIKNMKRTGAPEKGTLNGMTIYNVDGTGEVDGVSIEWSAYLIEAKKPVIALSFAAPGAYESHEKEIAAFVKSIKKMR